MRFWKRRSLVFLAVLAVLAALGVFGALAITVGGLVEDASKSDFALVLGNKVNEDGTPSDRLAARLERAGTLFDEQMCTFVIVSGGTGSEGHDEAKAMKHYLVSNGVPADRVIVDSEGWNTWDSAVNARSLAEAKGIPNPSVVAVSQYFHLPRCRLALRRVGFSKVSSSYARFLEPRDIYSIAREIPAYLKYLLQRPSSPAASGITPAQRPGSE